MLKTTLSLPLFESHILLLPSHYPCHYSLSYNLTWNSERTVREYVQCVWYHNEQSYYLFVFTIRDYLCIYFDIEDEEKDDYTQYKNFD